MQPSGSAADGKERARPVCRNWFFDLPWDLRRLIKRFVRVSMLCERFWHNLIALRELGALNRQLAISGPAAMRRLQHDRDPHRWYSYHTTRYGVTTEHCILVNRGSSVVFEADHKHAMQQTRLHQAMFGKPPPGRREKNRYR